MPGLILKLRPHEQLLINGVVVENGERKTRLRVRTEGANILRLRDAMRAEDATTPLKRAYYSAQMAVAGQLTESQAAILVEQALADHEDDGILQSKVMAFTAAGEFYKAMRIIKDAWEANAETAPPRLDAQTLAG